LIQLTTAARVPAGLKARVAVKDQIRRRGLKPSQYAAKDIKGWADVYLDEHPELIPEALASARAMILEGLLGKRAQRADRCAEHVLMLADKSQDVRRDIL
jgi:hypothetical protein